MKITRLIPETLIFVRKCFTGLIRGNDSVVARRLRRLAYRTQCAIDTNVYVTNARNFSAGEGSALYHGVYVLNTFGRFSMGEGSHLGAYCYVNACYGTVSLGDHVAVGPGTKIIAYSNHYERGRRVTDVRVTKDVVIGNNVFIGANCTILPGAVVGDNVVVAAGSIVKGQLESNAVYGGAPCAKLKEGWYQ